MKTRTSNIWRLLGNSKYTYLLVMIFITLIIIPMIFTRTVWNAWSISTMKNMLRPSSETIRVTSPPEDHPRSSLWQARTALISGNPDLTISLLEPMALQDDKFALATVGEALVTKGDYEEAIQVWAQAKNARAIKELAWFAEQANDNENALKALYALNDLNSESGTLPLVNFLFRTKQDPEIIEKLLQEAIQYYPNSENHSLWLQSLGDSLSEQGRWQEAIQAYQASMDKNPNITENYIGVAQALSNEGRYVEAERWYQQAISLQPENRWWYLQRANAAQKSNNLSLAIKVYEDAINHFPDFAQAYHEAAWVFRLDNQPAKAVATIEQAIAFMSPPNQWYYVRAGKIYEWVGNLEAARLAYHNALVINQENNVALQGLRRLKD